MDYEEFVRGCHLGVFPSYYEPWGYTPGECGGRERGSRVLGFVQFWLEPATWLLSLGMMVRAEPVPLYGFVTQKSTGLRTRRLVWCSFPVVVKDNFVSSLLACDLSEP